MRSIGRILGRGDAEERRPEVQALHDAMNRAARGSDGAEGEVYARLEHMPLWVFTVGTATDPERLRAQAALSGHVAMRFRVGRVDDGDFIAAATTRSRLVRWSLGQPGDDMVTLPIQLLAWAARDGGLTVVINPGSVPFARLAGPILASFADGVVPAGGDPAGLAVARRGQLTNVDTFDPTDLPVGLLETVADALRHESGIRRAVLVEQRLHSARVFVVLAVMDAIDISAVTDRVARRAATRLSPDDYFALERVDGDDARLNDRERSIEIISQTARGT